MPYLLLWLSKNEKCHLINDLISCDVVLKPYIDLSDSIIECSSSEKTIVNGFFFILKYLY